MLRKFFSLFFVWAFFWAGGEKNQFVKDVDTALQFHNFCILAYWLECQEMCPLSLGATIWKLFENSALKFMMKDVILKVISGSKIVGNENRPEGSVAQGR